MKDWSVVYRWAWVCCVLFFVLLVTVGVSYAFVPEMRRYKALQERKSALEKDTALLEARIQKLQSNQRRFQSDPDFTERVAREMGMARPGETIFRMNDERR